MAGILIAGTSSDAGKSLVVTGICRALARRGIDVAPFKAQNMSNNSMVCPDGSEIGRAQYLQAQAAGVQPSSILNPVLLKPGTDRRSFVVLRGRPDGTLEAGQYATGRKHLAEAAYVAYRQLADEHEIVIVEGAGSPAETNLRAGDYVNMGLAQQFNLPVVLVGDIDRGGILASLFGTWGIVSDSDRALLAGFIINKFRGDQRVLDPGLDEISRRTGMENLGVLPWLSGVWLDGEDALQVDRWRAELGPMPAGLVPLRVAVLRFPRISNATDIEALANTPGVDVTVTADRFEASAADLLILPGSRSTVDDLAWLREQGLDEVIAARHAAGRPILGICGGYQMLSQVIDDQIETRKGRVPGLGLLPIEVSFGEQKITTVATYSWAGHQVHGYEIHHGICTLTGQADPFLDGWRSGATFGTMLHGSLENDGFRNEFLSEVARATGIDWRPDPDAIGYAAAREQMIDTLADAVEEHVDLDRILELAGSGRDDQKARRAEPKPNPPLDARFEDSTSAPARAEVQTRPKTSRELRRQPRLIVNTGDGKGKSTAAFGIGLRAWSQGWSVGVFQFIKTSTWPTGERLAFQTLNGVHARTGQGGPVEWVNFGQGRTATRAGAKADQRGLAERGWREVRERLAEQRHDLLILDEFCHVLAKGWLNIDEVVDALTNRPGHQHVVITGRNAPEQLIDAADLVTEMRKIKHPFDKGEKGQEGIEW